MRFVVPLMMRQNMQDMMTGLARFDRQLYLFFRMLLTF